MTFRLSQYVSILEPNVLQFIEIVRDAIAADQIAFVPLHFVFDGAWEGLHKVVQITQCCETYNLILGTDGKSCLLPSECKAGTMKLSVFGYAPSDTKALRATTIPVSLHIKPSGFVSDSVTPIPPTPDLYAQLLQELEKKAAGLQNGKDGISPAVTVTETETGATISVTDATGKPPPNCTMVKRVTRATRAAMEQTENLPMKSPCRTDLPEQKQTG